MVIISISNLIPNQKKKTVLKEALANTLAMFGYRISRIPQAAALVLPDDFEDDIKTTIRQVAPYTMTSPERLYGLVQAVDHVVRHDVSGDFVECGVWRGGSIMAAARTLISHGKTDRTLWLYDTFEGMPEPTEHDRSRSGDAKKKFDDVKISEDASDWCRSTLDEVRGNFFSLDYPEDKVRFIKGKVEDTIPADIPDEIALLRLDTDWYESTRHELEHLYPRLVPGGVLIIDDYGHWEGCRKAVDEYFAGLERAPLLTRLDYTGRIGIKPL